MYSMIGGTPQDSMAEVALYFCLYLPCPALTTSTFLRTDLE